MASRQPSARNELKRKAAIFGVAFIGVGLVMHFTIPSFGFGRTLGWIVGLAFDYPQVAALVIGLVVIFYAMATVDDWFR